MSKKADKLYTDLNKFLKKEILARRVQLDEAIEFSNGCDHIFSSNNEPEVIERLRIVAADYPFIKPFLKKEDKRIQQEIEQEIQMEVIRSKLKSFPE